MRISDWSSDVCSSDLQPTVSSTCMNPAPQRFCKTTVSDEPIALLGRQRKSAGRTLSKLFWKPASQNGMPRTSLEKIRRSCGSAMPGSAPATRTPSRSEEHTSELQSLMRISYAVFCLKKKKQENDIQHITNKASVSQHTILYKQQRSSYYSTHTITTHHK